MKPVDDAHAGNAASGSGGDGANTRRIREYYVRQYAGERYAVCPSPRGHSFRPRLEFLIAQYGDPKGKWLEVGCGRGFLQDVVSDYTGVDLAPNVAAGMRKPFCCAAAEALPLPDNHFDGAWSYAALEHVTDPHVALNELRRVLKPGGILLLAPAWQCRPWAGRDYSWKSYGELSCSDRMLKALIPLRNALPVRALRVMPLRLCRLLFHALRPSPTTFRSRRLIPDYTEYRVADADARHSMDPFEAILWFRSRGDRVLSQPDWASAFFVRTGTLVVRVCKGRRDGEAAPR